MPAGLPVGPDKFGGTGYGDKPRAKDLMTTEAKVNEVPIRVVNHWRDRGELENVISALRRLKAEHLDGLESIEFVNRRIEGRNGRAYATYNPGLKRVLVTRDEPRDYRSSANRLNQNLATNTILHEALHHVWFKDKAGEIRRAWAMALQADGILVAGKDREEGFSDLFLDWFMDRRAYARIKPSLAAFYEQFLY